MHTAMRLDLRAVRARKEARCKGHAAHASTGGKCPEQASPEAESRLVVAGEVANKS